MDKPYIEVLKFLEEEGIGVYKNLSPLLMKMFPVTDITGSALYDQQVLKIKVLLGSLNDQIKLEKRTLIR